MKIRVAHIINHDMGLRVHGRNYFSYLQRQGYEVHVVCSPGAYVKGDMVTDKGVVVKAIPFPPRYTPILDLKVLLQLLRHLRQQRYDIVHTHTVKPGLLGRVAARLAGTPIVIHTVHGFHYWDDMSEVENRVFVWLERFAARFCDLLLSQNQEDIEFAIRERICSPDKIRFLGNGIDITRFRPDAINPDVAIAKRRELGIAPDEMLVGMIGRMVRLKGYFDYMQAARILHQRGERIKFLAIGAAQDKTTAISPPELINQYGLQDCMQFLGTRQDIPELMAAMDAVVLASYAEGIPRVLIEAAALGKPCVGTDVRGTREVIVEGETGYLVSPRNPAALADGISRLLADPARMHEMGQAARRRAETHFDERFYFWRTDSQYRRLIEARLSADRLQSLKGLPLEAGRQPI
jgi:glycosyltransferase involved in cell wall biosynthesis